MIASQRNVTLDYFKFVLVLLIISVHTDISQYGIIGWLISDGFSRVAVPCFLLINGYYFAQAIENKQKFKQYIIRLVIIYSVWTAIYSPFLWYMTGGGKKLILINILTGYYHLWYIASLIGASFIIYFTRKLNQNLLLIIAFVLFFIGYAIQKAYLFDIYIHMYPTIIRTFLFMGFPFMFLGYYIKQNNLENKAFFKSNALLFTTSILMILLLIESSFIYGVKMHEADPVKDELYIVLPILCPLLFLSILKLSKYKNEDGYVSKITSSIYFIHVLIIFMLTGSPYKADVIMFPIYIFLSALLSVPLLELNKRVKIFL